MIQGIKMNNPAVVTSIGEEKRNKTNKTPKPVSEITKREANIYRMTGVLAPAKNRIPTKAAIPAIAPTDVPTNKNQAGTM